MSGAFQLFQKEPSLLAPALGISDLSTIGEYMCVGCSHQHFMYVTLLKPPEEVNPVTTQSESNGGRTEGSHQVREEWALRELRTVLR